VYSTYAMSDEAIYDLAKHGGTHLLACALL
jgi:hypothetical protein